MAKMLRYPMIAMQRRSMRLWQFLDSNRSAGRAVRANASAHVGTQTLGRMHPTKREVTLATNNILLGKRMSVSLERRCSRGGGYRMQAKS